MLLERQMIVVMRQVHLQHVLVPHRVMGMEHVVDHHFIDVHVIKVSWEPIVLCGNVQKVLHGGMNQRQQTLHMRMQNVVIVVFAIALLDHVLAWMVSKVKLAKE